MTDGDVVVQTARTALGKPYVWDKAGPDEFDCSGLVVFSFKPVGKDLPHYTGSLIFLGSHVAKADLLPGDLVFPEPTHVQIYSGNGMVIEAAHPGTNVREVKMGGFWQGRRIVAPGSVSGSQGAAVSTAGLSIPGSGTLSDLETDAAKAWVSLSNPDTYKRIGLFVLAGLILVIALLFIFRKPAEAVADTTAKAALL